MGVRADVSRHEELRRMRGLTQAKLAAALGTSAHRVWSIEAGEAKAAPEYRAAFSRLVWVRERDVFDDQGWAL